jgi:hypothetical protein
MGQSQACDNRKERLCQTVAPGLAVLTTITGSAEYSETTSNTGYKTRLKLCGEPVGYEQPCRLTQWCDSTPVPSMLQDLLMVLSK